MALDFPAQQRSRSQEQAESPSSPTHLLRIVSDCRLQAVRATAPRKAREAERVRPNRCILCARCAALNQANRRNSNGVMETKSQSRPINLFRVSPTQSMKQAQTKFMSDSLHCPVLFSPPNARLVHAVLDSATTPIQTLCRPVGSTCQPLEPSIQLRNLTS